MNRPTDSSGHFLSPLFPTGEGRPSFAGFIIPHDDIKAIDSDETGRKSEMESYCSSLEHDGAGFDAASSGMSRSNEFVSVSLADQGDALGLSIFSQEASW